MGKRRNHYVEITPSQPLTAFQTGQADKADGKLYDCRFTNVDDRTDYFMGFNAPVEPRMARAKATGAGPRHREGGMARRGVNTRRMPAQRTRLNCYNGEDEQ